MAANNAKEVYQIVSKYAGKAYKDIYSPALNELNALAKSGQNKEVAETAKNLATLLTEHVTRLERGLISRGIQMEK